MVKVQDKITPEIKELKLFEDFEFRLNLKATYIQVHVFAKRTFGEDLLLFHNFVSLKKVFKTDEVLFKL